MKETELEFTPAVFVMENNYVIFIPVKSQVLLKIRVGEVDFYDNSNGVIRSSSLLHKVTVPMKALDRAGKYTVIYRKIIKRLAYCTESCDEVSVDFSFRCVPENGDINMYHIADTHGEALPAISAAEKCGKKIDLLILNGDIIDSSDNVGLFSVIYSIIDGITHGEIPVIFSRGNHDLRGAAAEFLADYIPTRHGSTFYTFRLGRLWGMVLDCGEDKEDGNIEYGDTVCCHAFRLEETEFLKNVISSADKEYNAPGVELRLLICHNTFTYAYKNSIFCIEKDIFTEWARLLREEIKPELMLCGHIHAAEIWKKSGEKDNYGQPCDIVVGAVQRKTENGTVFTGALVTAGADGFKTEFTSGDPV